MRQFIDCLTFGDCEVLTLNWQLAHRSLMFTPIWFYTNFVEFRARTEQTDRQADRRTVESV